MADRVAERLLEQVRERGLAERPDPDRRHRDPDLTGRDVVADRLDLRHREARAAPPSSASVSSRVRRERTSAYSAMTKNALTRTSSPARTMNRTFTEGLARARPAARGYFEAEGRRPSFSDRANGSSRHHRSHCSASNFFATSKSVAVRPPAEWLVSDSRTLFQPCTRMSGWWLASSATSATRLTNAIAYLKSSNFQSLTICRPRAPTRCPEAGTRYLRH